MTINWAGGMRWVWEGWREKREGQNTGILFPLTFLKGVSDARTTGMLITLLLKLN